MKIDFKNDIFVWPQEQNKRLSKPHDIMDIPSNRELYFESKLKEIVGQYQFARLFLSQIDNDKWEYWFKPHSDKDSDMICQIGFDESFLETSIIYYNIVVDLTWVLFFGCVGYAKNKKTGKTISIQKIMGIKEADDAFRELEYCVSHPQMRTDPFKKAAELVPQFKEPVDIITKFWNVFCKSEIRSLYNFIKHKGKPQYTEMYRLVGKKLYSISLGGKEIPTDLNDTRRDISLYDTVNKLIEFDNEKLFPYCDKLIKLLVPLAYDKSIYTA